MPHALVGGEKTAFINIVAAQNPLEAVWLATGSNFINYEDIATVIYRQAGGAVSSDFITYPNYLEAAIAVFTDSSLFGYGSVYNNKSEPSGLGDPRVLINTSVIGGITWSPVGGVLLILNNSVVDALVVSNNKLITTLTIGSGSNVAIATAISGTASIATINIKNLRDNYSTLQQITQGSTIGIVNIDTGAVFGGYGVNPVSGSCALVVSNLTASAVFATSMTISWTNPAGWLFNYLYYKNSNSNTWILVDDNIGKFVGDTGFVFTQLTPNTTYNFRVNVKCANGVLGSYVTISQETTT